MPSRKKQTKPKAVNTGVSAGGKGKENSAGGSGKGKIYSDFV